MRFHLPLKKPVLFASAGALGCFLGALLGELILVAFSHRAPPPAVPKVDVVFVLDVTSSMQPQIDGVREGIIAFAYEMRQRGIDARYGAIAFRDATIGERPEILQFAGGPFTSEPGEFQAHVRQLRAEGGGDIPESSLDALVAAAGQPFREGAGRVLILITDAPPKLPDAQVRSVRDAATALGRCGVDQLHLVVNSADLRDYASLQSTIPGEFFALEQFASGRSDFAQIMPRVGTKVAERTLQALQGTSETAPASSLILLLLSISLWTAMLALGMSLALINSQRLYLHRPWLKGSELILPVTGSIIAGAIAGACGQLLFSVSVAILPLLSFVARLAGWSVLGGLVGRGMTYFVPNLPRNPATFGAAAGGAAGAVAFLACSAILGDVAGRLMGAVILGACIGLMVACVEVAMRSAWLEIRYGKHEQVQVSLGATPVTVGGDARKSTIFVLGAKPVALAYRLEAGEVFCTDYVTELAERASNDSSRVLGNVTITVRTGPAPISAKNLPIAPPPPPPLPTRGPGSSNVASTNPAPPPAPPKSMTATNGTEKATSASPSVATAEPSRAPVPVPPPPFIKPAANPRAPVPSPTVSRIPPPPPPPPIQPRPTGRQ